MRKLDKLTGFIAENGTRSELTNKDVQYACNICDALYWILGEISTENFTSDTHLNLEHLERLARSVEERTENKLADYE